MTVFSPADLKETGEVVKWAAAEEQPLEIIGGGSKRGLGRPTQAANQLSLARIAGISSYEAPELVLTAAAATPLPEIEAALLASNQMLAFEPVDWRALHGTEDTQQTLGGVISCNLAGPRRIKAGAARDHVLGFHGVNGRGEPFKSGGKVVKNVTGYDLSKLVAGAYGTLAVMTEFSVKVLPRPEEAQTVLVLGLEIDRALEAMGAALGSAHEVSGAAHLPRGAAASSAVAEIAGGGTAVTVLRVEGPKPSVAHRCTGLRDLLSPFGTTERLGRDGTETLWREIGDARLLPEPRSRAIWRVSTPPTAAPLIAQTLARELDADLFFDWGGGLIWAAVSEAAPDGGTKPIRGALAGSPNAGHGGHATLIRGSEALRAGIDVFEPLPPPLAELTMRVKESFDPRRVLNPGRMYAGV